MAQFIFKDATYELVDAEDLTFQEISDMETYTGFDMAQGKVSVAGMVWISVRRRYPNTTWDDVKNEKLLKIEWLADEDDAVPPTSNGAAASSLAAAPAMPAGPTDSGDPG